MIGERGENGWKHTHLNFPADVEFALHSFLLVPDDFVGFLQFLLGSLTLGNIELYPGHSDGLARDLRNGESYIDDSVFITVPEIS